jgi:hypothetical protein
MSYVLEALCAATSYTKTGRHTLATKLCSPILTAMTETAGNSRTASKQKRFLVIQATGCAKNAPTSRQGQSRPRQNAIPTPNANTAVEIDGIGGP